jgi:hypothetical protein
MNDELLRAAGEAFGPSAVATPPSLLYHFTDAGGFAGILGSRSLWASRARSLNDPTEVAYGLDLARERLREATGLPTVQQFYGRVLDYLDGRGVDPDLDVVVDPFVISFCAHADGPLHWLHYGHSGKGYALAFESAALPQPPFVLTQVIYDADKQAQIVDQALARFAALEPKYGTQPKFVEAAANACAVGLRALAGRLKDPRFAPEREWRLISLSMHGTHVHSTAETDPQPIRGHRVVDGRIVSYVVRQFDSLPLQEVSLGYSSPQPVAEMREVLLHADLDQVRVRRSTLPLR